jgi:hypothetical protein
MFEKDAVDLLVEARMWVDKGWCQNWYAETEVGVRCTPLDSLASSWCMLGALARASESELRDRTGFYFDAEELLVDAVGEWPPDWQDAPGRTKEEVLAAFDRAISLGLRQ